MSDAGHTTRDVLLGLMKACGKRGPRSSAISVTAPDIPGAITIPQLPDLVRQAATD